MPASGPSLLPAIRRDRPGQLRFQALLGKGQALGAETLGPIHRLTKFARHQMFPGHAVQREEVAVARGLQHHLARAPVEGSVDQDRSLCRIPIVRIVGSRDAKAFRPFPNRYRSTRSAPS